MKIPLSIFLVSRSDNDRLECSSVRLLMKRAS